jgi:predicted Zn-dependent protease
VLVLEKPPVTMPLAAVLIWRSESRTAQDQYLAALGNALTAYRADDFAQAARRLQVLARDHPTAEVRFYLGVCRIFLGHEDLAIAELGQARKLAQPALAREATWYLAVAYERAGRPDAAAAELATLCGEEGERQAKACEALRAGLLSGSAILQRR